ncbi:hypothetical protein NKI09_23625 [Mesorhizobium sp. M0757]
MQTEPESDGYGYDYSEMAGLDARQHQAALQTALAGESVPWGIDQIGARAACRRGYAGQGVVVAVVAPAFLHMSISLRRCGAPHSCPAAFPTPTITVTARMLPEQSPPGATAANSQVTRRGYDHHAGGRTLSESIRTMAPCEGAISLLLIAYCSLIIDHCALPIATPPG